MSILLPVTDPDYIAALNHAFRKFAELFHQKEQIEVELLKLRQYIHATLNMLPDEQRATYQQQLDELASELGGVTDAVRGIMRIKGLSGGYLTATQVRDQLVNSGFSFTGYTSNPLATVNTILRRFAKSGEVEIKEIEGVSAYRIKRKTSGRFEGRFEKAPHRFEGRFKK